jgi:hypothetical protein
MEIKGVVKINDTLEPKVWRGDTLNSSIRKRLITIAEDFFDDLGFEEAEIEDITFTGSLANYNWTKYSDIDLHLIIDFSKIDENFDLVREFFSAKTSNWNKLHNITVFGYEVEIYVQDRSEEHHSTGVFSIKNGTWLTKPTRIEPDVDEKTVRDKISSYVDMIDRAEDHLEEKNYKEAYDYSVKLAKKIKKFRQSGLEETGEYSHENLTFKYLRNNGFIKSLFDVRNDSYDKMMSIEGDFDKKFKIFVGSPDLDEEKGFNRLNELEKYQRKLKTHHSKMKKRLTAQGLQFAGSPFVKKPSYKRGKSAPPG